MNFQFMGETLAIAGKMMTKLNNKLDKVLERLAEFEDVATQKEEAINLINNDDFEAALELVKVMAKGEEKHRNLLAEEVLLRQQLEDLRVKAEAVAGGSTEVDIMTEEESTAARADGGSVTQLKPNSDAA